MFVFLTSEVTSECSVRQFQVKTLETGFANATEEEYLSNKESTIVPKVSRARR